LLTSVIVDTRNGNPGQETPKRLFLDLNGGVSGILKKKKPENIACSYFNRDNIVANCWIHGS